MLMSVSNWTWFRFWKTSSPIGFSEPFGEEWKAFDNHDWTTGNLTLVREGLSKTLLIGSDRMRAGLELDIFFA